MRLHSLRLRNFRGTADRTVAFADRGVTVVEGPNEIGKSSLAEALDLLLEYQAHSKARAVRQVQPVGQDVATEIAAELSCGAHRFTYTKRFNRDHATTLVLHAPRREQLSGAPAHERVRALLAEHVDEALWRALRIYQGVPLEQADLSRQTSLAAALDVAAGARIGGERESALLERLSEVFERYHTPTGQATRARRDLAAAEEGAAADVADAVAALQAVEDDVARCADLERALGEVAPRLDESAARAAQAAAAWRALERRQVEADRLGLAAQRAADQRDQAAEAVERRHALVERRARAEHDLADARSGLDRHAPAMAVAERDAAAAAVRVETLTAAVAEARVTARARLQALDTLRDVETLAGLEERIVRLEGAQAEAAAAAAALDGLAVDDDVLASIERALAAVQRARAVAQAGAPRLRVRRLAPVTVAVDGNPVGAGNLDQRVNGSATVRIGELAEVRVDTARHDGHAAEVAAAERTLADLVDACGVEDVPAAREAHRRRIEAAAELERARRTLSDVLGTASAAELYERRAACARRVNAGAAGERAPLAGDVHAARAAADRARDSVDRREADLAAAESALREARSRREALAEATARGQVRVEAAEQALAAATAALRTARLEAADEALGDALRARRARAEQAALAHRGVQERLAAADPDGAQAALDAAVAVRDRLAKEQRALEDDLRDTRARLAVRGEEGLHDRLANAQARLAAVARERARVEARATAARVLHTELAARREDATRAYAAPLRDKLEGLGRIVYGDGFGVELAPDLRIARRTLGPVTLDYEQLSAGAREQLALLARLAVAALVASDGGVPLLIDDALGSSDPARLERLGAALRVGARDAQVIVLTCVPERYRTVGDATVVRLV